MIARIRVFAQAVPLVVCLTFAGCGGASGGPPPTSPPTPPAAPAVSVSFDPAPPSSTNIGTIVSLNADVSNASNTLVTWSVSCAASGACGTFGQSTPNSNVITYFSPNLIPVGKTVTITATSNADPTKFISATITITAKVAFTSALPAVLQVGRSASFDALITQQSVSPDAQVQWSATCASSDCGSFNPTITSNEGAASTTYTAPASVPSGNSVTITATSSADPTQQVSASINIAPAAPVLANGTYAFQITNPENVPATYVTGVIVAQDGQIVGGEQDSNAYATEATVNGLNAYLATPQHSLITGGSYDTMPDGSFELTLDYPSTTIWSSATLKGVLASAQQGFTAQLYGLGGSGILQLQTSTALPAGGYAVSLKGGDQSFQSFAWWGGILNFDGAGQISGAGSILDYISENGVVSPLLENQTLGASSISSIDTNGRFQINLHPGAGAEVPSLNLVGYVVSPSEVLFIETGGDAFQGVVSGIGIGQGTLTGNFSSASVAGNGYAFGASGLGSNGPLNAAGIFTLANGGGVTGMLNWDDMTVLQPQSPLVCSGTWAIDSNGRLTISNLTDGYFHYTLHLYLTGDGNALLLSNSAQNIWLAGQVFARQSAISSAAFDGPYAVEGAQAQFPYTYIFYGPIGASLGANATNLAGFGDADIGSDFSITGSFTQGGNGILTGNITGLDVAHPASSEPYSIYLIDNNRAIAIEVLNTQLEMGLLQRLQ